MIRKRPKIVEEPSEDEGLKYLQKIKVSENEDESPRFMIYLQINIISDNDENHQTYRKCREFRSFFLFSSFGRDQDLAINQSKGKILSYFDCHYTVYFVRYQHFFDFCISDENNNIHDININITSNILIMTRVSMKLTRFRSRIIMNISHMTHIK